MELDREILEKAAREALERPSNASFWDDRLFTTHGAVFHWAERGDDLLEESNYLTALDLIKAAADDGRPDTEVSDEHVIDGTSSHWAVGSLRTIYVQVYVDETPECAWEDCDGEAGNTAWIGEIKGPSYCTQHIGDGLQLLAEGAWVDAVAELAEDYDDFEVPDALSQSVYEGKLALTKEKPVEREFTAAFVEATELALSLQDYPILDDSDYSEREWEGFEAAMKEAVEQAQREYALVDTSGQDDEIAQRFYEDESTTHRSQWCRADDVSWTVVEEEYREARGAYFLEKATEVYRWNMLGYNPDQLELFAGLGV
ncbi:hypothetical protein [Streptomyces sp. NPDC051546]|uniref:hypothetical protein n=1 Tax=Streptomyces sp. NPDC051546 TaxID=3365655 RepID=UPI003792617E